jgi:putative Mg2+ transporter-C (MgtC) family protein
MADVWSISNEELVLRLLCAVVMGGTIGWEREISNHSAGFRTHILVCVGSALIMLLSIYGFGAFAEETNVRMDPARLAAQVISGIGFLGAGTILHSGMTVRGLTTAASLWVVAAIGLSVGAGFYLPAAVVTVIVLTSLLILNRIEGWILKSRKTRQIQVTTLPDVDMIRRLNRLFRDHDVTVRQMSVTDQQESSFLRFTCTLSGKRKDWLDLLLADISRCEGVHSVTLLGNHRKTADQTAVSR